MGLTISKSEWRVLFWNLYHGKLSENMSKPEAMDYANDEVKEHKKILEDYKEKLQKKIKKAIEQHKRALIKEKKPPKQIDKAILKFSTTKEIELETNFRNKFFEMREKANR